MVEFYYKIENNFHTVSHDCNITVRQGHTLELDLSTWGHIYGYGFNHYQPYPLEKTAISNPRFEVNNIQSPIWLGSEGIVIWVDTRQSLSIEFNNCKDKKLYIRCDADDLLVKVYLSATLQEAHRRFLSEIKTTNHQPADCFIGDSIFCTWTQYPRCITQDRVLGFAAAIRENSYPCSAVIIDDRWESRYGDLSFSSDFPDPKSMVNKLHEQGFQVILWVTPFFNTDSGGYEELKNRQLLVWSKEEKAPAHFKWWGGEAGLIDLTNTEAYNWYKEKLCFIKNGYGIDGFKIDGGDAKYQPNLSHSNWHDFQGASAYSDRLLALFEEVAPGMCETRTAWLSQNRNIVWRQGGKDSHWGEDNGLKAVVHLALHMSLMGYDFLIPDMVGGRVQTMSTTDPLPTDELFLRFAEASVCMPSLQFSYYPWNYGKETGEAAAVLAGLHKALEWYVRELLQDRHVPIIRPIWYGDEREELFIIDDEFMLGNDLLAAPVLDSGLTQRRVVLPKGNWIDVYTGETYKGGDDPEMPAPCPGMPIFVRETNRRLLDTVQEAIKGYPVGSVKPQTTTAHYQAGIHRSINVTG